MKQLITELRSCLLFITILPVGKQVDYSPVGMIKFFPVAGLILGGLLAGFDAFISLFWPLAVVALLDVLLLVVLTGAFHLDGLGDSADGLFSHRSRERALEIMKDSRSGMMGLVAVFCILAMKTAGLYAVKTSLSGPALVLTLILVPAFARSSMIFGIKLLKYGRKGSGTGLGHFERPLGFWDFSFFGVCVILSFFLGFQGLVLNIVFFTALFSLLFFYHRKMGCITGDMLGAMTEVMEPLLFLAAGAAWMNLI